MISITLQFASLEAARKALLEIPENLLASVPPPWIDAGNESQAAAMPAPTPAPAPVAAPSRPTAKRKADPAQGDALAPFDYATLKQAVMRLATKDRERALSIATEFGVEKFQDLPQAKWPEALARATEMLAELEASA